MQNLAGDIRYALRQFRLAPVFTLTAMLTLALGIGGTTAIFSLIHAVMLRSLPVADPQTLYRIGDGNDCCVEGGPQDRWGMYPFALYERLRSSAPEFEQMAAFQASGVRFSVRRASVERIPRPLRGEYVTGNYFTTFGIRPFAGALLSPADDNAGARPVAVLSYHAWQESYGSDPSVIGGSFAVEGHPFTVIGIAPPGFYGETLRSDPPDIWLPLQHEPMINREGSLLHQTISAWLRVIGRTKPGANLNGMSARLTGVLRTWMKNESGYPSDWLADIERALPKQNVNVVPAGAGVAEMKEGYGRSLNILLTVCSLVLLIACANIANLLLARGMARRAQTSLRIAVGASRGRIIRQSLTESVLLAIGGGILGLLVANGAGRLILALTFHEAHFIPIDVTPSLVVLAFAFALSLVTGVLFGTAPAWFATHADPAEALRGAGRGTHDRSSVARTMLLVVQATLSVVLVAGAALLTRSLRNLEHQDFGYQTANRVMISFNPPPATYNPDQLDTLYRNVERKLKEVPGVLREGLAMYNPLTDNWGEIVWVSGHPAPKMSEQSVASWDRVSPTFLETLGQPILRGRGFTEADNLNAPNVALVNEKFVKRFFPNEDPMDKHFGIDAADYAGTYRIIGIVRDAKYTDPTNPARAMFYAPLAQRVNYNMAILRMVDTRSHFITGAMLETHSAPGVLEPLLRKAIAEVDPNLPIISVRSLQDQIDRGFDQQRAVASLAGLFGMVALILAAVGLYGVTAYTVARRTSEIGVRMALGADRASVTQLVLRGAFAKVAIGLALGIPLSIGAGRLIAAQLYGVTTWDPMALTLAIGSLGLCAFIAAVIPAMRAASIDPVRALRVE